MASSPPLTPTSSRHNSIVSGFSGTPQGRRASSARSSTYSPTHSRHASAHHDSLADELGGVGGSLADELGGGWDGDEDDEEEEEEYESGPEPVEQERDSGIDVASSPANGLQRPKVGLLQVQQPARGHKRAGSVYDGSEYGSDSDLEASELVNASLEARLAAVESLARRGTGDVRGEEGVISRTIKKLQDLGGQAEIESWTTRLCTAHTAITTHLMHQTRHFQNLSSTLFSPFEPPLPPEIIDDIMPALTATLAILPTLTLPRKTSHSLHLLAAETADLIDTLSSISDTVHMNRQTSLAAGPRLRAVKDVLGQWRREGELRDQGVRWIEEGGWDQRLRDRECASVCGEVMGGFEEVCGKWRESLVEAAGIAAG